jgi:flavin reductase (DIM6/NTAB) family NADH-FMN oxidoreductase RutF
MPDDLAKPNWAAALGKIPSGLFVITVASHRRETGFLASWVQQCSFDPPQLTFAVNNQRPIREWLAEGVAVTVNVIPEGGKSLVAHFGKGFAPDESAFEGIEVERSHGSAPCLTAALAWLKARVVSHHAVGDHTLVVVRVVEGQVLHDGKPTVHVRRDGTKY